MTDDEEHIHELRLIAAAGPLSDEISIALRKAKTFTDAYALRMRVKDEDRLRDKIASRRKDGDDTYDVDRVSDILGIRYIFLYRQEIPGAVDAFLDMMLGDGREASNPFSGAKLEELRSYVSNALPDKDPVNIEIARVFEKYEGKTGVRFEPVPKARYSSVHMVIRIPFKHGQKKFVVPVEIQLRSVFEDAWGQIDHELFYKLGRFGEQVDPAHRETMAQHMGVLKKLMDTAADYADVIRRYVTDSRSKAVGIERNLDGADYIIELSNRLGVSPQIRERMASNIRKKAALDKELESRSLGASALEYIEIAEKFSELIPLLEAAEDSDERRN